MDIVRLVTCTDDPTALKVVLTLLRGNMRPRRYTGEYAQDSALVERLYACLAAADEAEQIKAVTSVLEGHPMPLDLAEIMLSKHKDDGTLIATRQIKIILVPNRKTLLTIPRNIAVISANLAGGRMFTMSRFYVRVDQLRELFNRKFLAIQPGHAHTDHIMAELYKSLFEAIEH